MNTAILGTVGYYSYINWDKPTWDRRTVSAVSIGLLTLWGGEGYVSAAFRLIATQLTRFTVMLQNVIVNQNIDRTFVA